MLGRFFLQELARVLEEKFGYTSEEAEAVAGFVESSASAVVAPSEAPQIIPGNKADNQILACVLEAKADYLVTGDLKHIYSLRTVGTTKIVSSAEFLAVLRSRGGAAA